MRFRISTLLLFALRCVASHATDRVVVPGGILPVYSTISAALAASANNDRILITPATYTGDITITKSVEMTCTVPGQRYTVVGNMSISPTAGAKIIAVHSMALTGFVSTSMNPEAHSFSMHGSTTGFIDVEDLYNTRSVFTQDTINGFLYMRGGNVVGCRIKGGQLFPGDAFNLLRVNGISDNPTPCWIIGNHIGSTNELADPAGSVPVQLLPQSPIHFENNYVQLFATTYSQRPIAFYTPDFDNMDQSWFVNNTVHWSNTGSTLKNLLWFEDFTAYSPLDVRNNLLVGPLHIALSGPGSYQAYNLQTSDLAQINLATGRPITGSIAANAGDTAPEYTDLDFSRNDIGCYGGSLSRDQFDNALPNTALATWVDAQRRAVTSFTTPIIAHGTDR